MPGPWHTYPDLELAYPDSRSPKPDLAQKFELCFWQDIILFFTHYALNRYAITDLSFSQDSELAQIQGDHFLDMNSQNTVLDSPDSPYRRKTRSQSQN